ncbi:entericidin A/B family lipoprotein [Chthonobacter rhizosphaerae]|nr:entericidin A/B family lipoprotein [Chthonobacter rhizosphaerae]
MSKSFVALVAVLISSFVLSACDNTVRGVGRDVRETGDAVEDVAR